MMYLPWLMLLLGAVARIFLPFLMKLRNTPDLSWTDFDMRYIWPQLISLVIFVLVLPVLVSDLAGIGGLALQEAFLIGYGAAAFGRLADNGIEVVRNG